MAATADEEETAENEKEKDSEDAEGDPDAEGEKGEEVEDADDLAEIVGEYDILNGKASPPADESDDEKNHFDDEDQAEEELRDAIEGTLRLKRLLSRDAERGDGAEELTEAARKKRKTDVESRLPEENAKVAMLLAKWRLKDDPLTRHVLEGHPLHELIRLHESGYRPDTSSVWKCPAELLNTHMAQVRESLTPGGGPQDMIKCFRFRWKLGEEEERQLRALPHRELRYVLEKFDGQTMLQECIDLAKTTEEEAEGCGENAASDFPGLLAMSRYNRLELIDPCADSAVFGDANLSFAVNLAQTRKNMGHVGRVIATTFENKETLQERYREIDDTILELEKFYAEVYHEVDCTRIALDKRFQGLLGALGAVYYNFPHAGAVGGFFDGHPVVNWRHENLMRLFFRALRSYVKPGGTVKVASNASAVGVRWSYIVDSAVSNEFVHEETMPFLKWQLHRYGRSYGDRRDTYKRPGSGERYNSQHAEKDMVYCFVYRPSGKALPRQRIRLPPTYKTMLGVTDGPLGERTGEKKRQCAAELYKRFALECSGIHVG
eukprot:TRINITY_DN30849_c0_g1_i1.p1 TRINITY_DN30849_c0_g1~~TRINITY_DN30849_c0_g1_i1.p1  ORF type:complete len:579 (+),score=155.91 TRINITY_DN30849_c0_g1_i1:93-1739(+)